MEAEAVQAAVIDPQDRLMAIVPSVQVAPRSLSIEMPDDVSEL